MMLLPALIHAQQVVLLFKARGVRHIIISPGSRNAPLIIGFTADPFFSCYSIVDERCAAHVALGIAQQLKEPAAVVCTSGSALLNYYPAIAEAVYSEIPLIILSADRPAHKIDIGDGQTIRQQHVFANHILYDAQLEDIQSLDQKEEIATNERYINKAIDISIEQHGPVHINIPFEEPLYKTVTEPSLEVKVIRSLQNESNIVPQQFIEQWEQATKKLVILATLNPNVLNENDLEVLLKDPSVLVLSEVSSNIVHNDIVWGIDTLLAPIENEPEEVADLRPDMVVTIGGMIVSKKIKQFLRTYKTTHHYHVGTRRAYDTFFKLNGHIKIKPATWSAALPNYNGFNKLNSDYKEKWLGRFKTHVETGVIYQNDMVWSDFKALEVIFKSLPDNIVLQLGNSSTIRYAQLFQMNESHTVFSNRGTSGIDGSTSTAAGAAIASHKPVIFITGDISFLYDSNGLWNNYVPDNFKIIVINNNGGGIFRILPSDKSRPEFETYFETVHSLDASHLSAMFNYNYNHADSQQALESVLPKFLKDDNKPQLLEVFTPRLENDTVLLNYFKYLR